MHGVAGGAEGHGFVVLAFEDFDFCGGTKMEVFEKIEEAFFLFVDTNNFGGIVELQFRKKHRAFLAKLSESAAQGNPMRTGFVSSETLHEESFDFGGDGVFHALGFGMRFGPGEADDFREKHLGELVAEREMLGDFAALGGEKNASTALNFDVTIACHAFEGGGDGWRSDVELFSEASADGHLVFFEHFPDGFEVVFARNAGFVALQGVSCWRYVPDIFARSSESSGAKAPIVKLLIEELKLRPLREIQKHISETLHKMRLL